MGEYPPVPSSETCCKPEKALHREAFWLLPYLWLVLASKMIPEALRHEPDHKARVIEPFIHIVHVFGLFFLPADS